MRPSFSPFALLVLLSVPSTAAAQLEDYRFRGQVLDTQGNGLAQVDVTLRESETGQRIVFKTKKDGSFDRRLIPHGKYKGTFEKAGYVTATQDFDWSKSAADVITIESKIVLQSEVEKQKSEVEQGKAELSRTASRLYETAYKAFEANDCAATEKSVDEILSIGAGTYEYAVRYLRARCIDKRGDAAAAEPEYRKAIELKPDLFGAHFDLAGLLERQGKHEEAIAMFARAAELKPDDAESLFYMGTLLYNQGKYDEARGHLTRSVELKPDHAQATRVLGLANLSAQKKDMKEALRLLKRYLELQPGGSDASQVQEIVKELEREVAKGK